VLPCEMFVAYEYGQMEPGEEFNRDDISWCQVFLRANGSLSQVFDDETS
jgi:hypothetical protein